MKKLIFLIGNLILGSLLSVYADSPVTSTYWADKYKEVALIAKRIEKNKKGDQVLTDEELNFLLDDKIPFAHRVTLINANGWNINGLNNMKNFLLKLLKKYGVKTENELIEKANEYDLMVWAYLLVMDDYFKVEKPFALAMKSFEILTNKVEKPSLAFFMILVIIKGQGYLDNMNLWCDIYKNYEAVMILNNKGSLIKDFKNEALEAINEYLGIYKETCNE